MSKRKNKDPGRAHPQQSFEQMVANATLGKFQGYIDALMQQAGQSLLQRQQENHIDILTRIVTIEAILMETVPGLTKEALANRVADTQDRQQGLVPAEQVELGDRTRLEIKTKTVDQTEFQGQSRIQLDSTGSGHTLGAEIEAALLGMKVGETKSIKFGKDQSMEAELSVHRISRAKPVPQESKE